MKQNLNSVDRILRFALAVWWLSPLVPQFSASWANSLVAVIAWIALIESFIGWCGLHNVLHLKNNK
ncbi:MAG: DUF2892 domain-containing protein [Candidatus Woesearchaeota archaeon]|nr:DUF2892 domain-containing protein [Candidatus Woesearchaeota archaeon]